VLILISLMPAAIVYLVVREIAAVTEAERKQPHDQIPAGVSSS